MSKHNWPGLKAEYNLGDWKNPTSFAKDIGINPSQLRKAFKALNSLDTGEKHNVGAKQPTKGAKGKGARKTDVKGANGANPQKACNNPSKQSISKKKKGKESPEYTDLSPLKDPKPHVRAYEAPKQETFINEKLRGKTNTEAAEIAGYAFPAQEGSRLMADPRIKQVIVLNRQALREKYLAQTEKSIQRMIEIGMVDLQEVLSLSEGELEIITDDNGNLPRGLKKIKVKKTILETEAGPIETTEIEIELHDPVEALGQVHDWLGTFDDDSYNHINSGNEKVIKIWTYFMGGYITALQTAHWFQGEGLGVPTTILAHMKAELMIPEDDASAKSSPQDLDYDFLESRSKRSQAEVEQQLKEFLPERFATLQKLKAEFGNEEGENPDPWPPTR